jgi:hypothetical protein
MKVSEASPSTLVRSSGLATSRDASFSQIAIILAGLEEQKAELGPIADELIDLFHHLGAGQPPP